MTEYCFSILGVRRRAISGPIYFWSRPRGIRSASAWDGLTVVQYKVQLNRGNAYEKSGQEVMDFWDRAGPTHIKQHNCSSIGT